MKKNKVPKISNNKFQETKEIRCILKEKEDIELWDKIKKDLKTDKDPETIRQIIRNYSFKVN